MRRFMSQPERTVSSMNPDTADALRRQAHGFLRTIDDPRQAHEVRVVASSALGWTLFYLPDDETLLTDILVAIRRAIERGDPSPLVLLHDIGPTIHSNVKFAEAVARLGELALERRDAFATARVTIALVRRTGSLVHAGESPSHLRAPARWIRALVRSAEPDQLDSTVRDAVRWWLDDEGNDLDALRDLIPDPSTWGNVKKAIPSENEASP
jgi:hypothetical protein